MNFNYKKYLETMFDAIEQTKDFLLSGFNNIVDVEYKDDHSPVTKFDKEVDLKLRQIISKAFPDYGFLTEESSDDLSRINKDFVWIIDPIDGTVEFVTHTYEFVTNIALSYKGEIICAAIFCPLTNEIFYACKGKGTYVKCGDKIKKVHVSDNINELTYISSPHHKTKIEEDFINNHQNIIKKVIYAGAGRKACLIANGEADISYRLNGNTKEWDTAACQLIVIEAGGIFLDGKGKHITYNKKDIANHDGFIMINRIENLFL